MRRFCCCCSLTRSCPTLCDPWTAALQASLSFTISWSLLKLMSIESVMSFNHLILCHPLLLLPSIFLSIRVFSNESALCIRWPRYWSFSFSTSPCNEYSGLISFKIDWFDLLAVQGTLKSLLKHHSLKASTLWSSAFFMVQLPGGNSGKEPICQCRKCKKIRFNPWVGKIPWSRTWQSTPLFLPGKSYGQRSLVVYRP